MGGQFETANRAKGRRKNSTQRKWKQTPKNKRWGKRCEKQEERPAKIPRTQTKNAGNKSNEETPKKAIRKKTEEAQETPWKRRTTPTKKKMRGRFAKKTRNEQKTGRGPNPNRRTERKNGNRRTVNKLRVGRNKEIFKINFAPSRPHVIVYPYLQRERKSQKQKRYLATAHRGTLTLTLLLNGPTMARWVGF